MICSIFNPGRGSAFVVFVVVVVVVDDVVVPTWPSKSEREWPRLRPRSFSSSCRRRETTPEKLLANVCPRTKRVSPPSLSLSLSSVPPVPPFEITICLKRFLSEQKNDPLPFSSPRSPLPPVFARKTFRVRVFVTVCLREFFNEQFFFHDNF